MTNQTPETVETVAGVLVGEPRSVIVRYDKTEERIVAKMRILGRRFYVRECMRPEAEGDIVLPEKTWQDTTVCLVLAIGEGCGKRDNQWKRRGKATKHFLNGTAHLEIGDIEPMDYIVSPMSSPFGITHGAYSHKEYFLNETEIIARIKQEHDND